MEPFRILSLDGGGIRGILPLSLLERLDSTIPFLSKTDLFAGTSIGGIIALGLAAGLTPRQLIKVFTDTAPDIFQTSIWTSIVELGGVIGAPFSLDALHTKIESLIGDMRIGDLKHHVLIPTFDLDANVDDIRRSKPKFFHTFCSEDLNERVVDIALRTSSAPSYFPVFQGFIDGGVIANNPSMCAVAEAINPQRGARTLDQIRMLSLGTGHLPNFIDAKDEDWGGLQWTRYITNIFVDGRADVIDYQCEQLLQENYQRLNPFLPFPIDIDSVEHINLLASIGGKEPLVETLQWLEELYLN